MATIFTKIINGEIPCNKIDEDQNCIAFLDINPINLGHALVVPKKEIDYIYDLDDDLISQLFIFSKRIGNAIQRATKCKRIGVIVAGYEVPHAHVHLIPTNSMADFNFAKARRADQSELAEIAEKIRAEL